MHPWDLFGGYEIPVLPCEKGIVFDVTKLSKDEGIYLLIDLGREDTGLLNLKLYADSGTIVDIGYGQHLEDLRVRTEIMGRNFGNRYICKDGEQEFTHYFSRISGRYVQLHILNITENFKLYYAGILPIEYPMANLVGRQYLFIYIMRMLWELSRQK